MYAEDDLSLLMKHQSKESLKAQAAKRAKWLEEYLYLPSHITDNSRKEAFKKYGPDAILVQKDVSSLLKSRKLHFSLFIH